MLRFIDGPADGVTMQCQRAPIYLRVVCSCPDFGALSWDALDQLGDQAAPGETIHVYRRVGEAGWLHYDGRDKHGRRFGRTIATGEYRYLAEQPSDEVVRDNALWQRWAQERHEADRAESEQPR